MNGTSAVHAQQKPELAGSRDTDSAVRVGIPLLVLLVTAFLYASIYSREESLPTAIGANLVPAERVLKGEVPYRDFYKIQTPGILLLNAGLFKLLGTSLITAFRGVLLFKIVSVLMVFLISRRLMHWRLALIPPALAAIWLPPGGPFRPAPVQYEMPFILAATYLSLRWVQFQKARALFGAGLCVGVVILFKQNVGGYCLIALGLSIVIGWSLGMRRLEGAVSAMRRSILGALLGVALPVAALTGYLLANGALGAALRIFVRGPAEHLQMKFTGYPLPKFAAPVLAAGAVAVIVAFYLINRSARLWPWILVLVMGAAGVSAVLVPMSVIDNSIYWFGPVLFVIALGIYVSATRTNLSPERRATLVKLAVLTLFSLASFGEVFPRSVRGLVIDTLPPALILCTYMIVSFGELRRPFGESVNSAPIEEVKTALVLGSVSLVLFVFGARMSIPHYFRFHPLGFRADTQLTFDRGRGMFLPESRAAETDAIVEMLRTAVPEGGFFFAHSVDASSYYFLADRNSPTGATLWNDAGTDDNERERTMESLRRNDIRIILTTDQALGAERYQPLLDFMSNDFHEAVRIGKTILLERDY